MIEDKMDATHPTAGWEKVGDRFYRKIQLYTAVFDQDLELDNYIVAGALYGGAIGESISTVILLCWQLRLCVRGFVDRPSHLISYCSRMLLLSRICASSHT